MIGVGGRGIVAGGGGLYRSTISPFSFSMSAASFRIGAQIF